MTKFRHECPEYDLMTIDETFVEFACCLCFRGDKEAEKLYKIQSDVINKERKDLDALMSR